MLKYSSSLTDEGHMRKGKIILFGLWCLLFAGNARSEELSHCARLENYLIPIDQKLQGMRPDQCEAKDPISQTCPSLYELELKRNDLMAKLVLAESSEALAQVIEHDSMAVKRLTINELNDAQSAIENLLFNLNKSEIITQAIEQEVFSDISSRETLGLEHFLEKLKTSCAHNNANVCSQIENYPPKQKDELILTFYGLDRSLLKVMRPADRAQQLAKIKQSLAISVVQNDEQNKIDLKIYKEELKKLQEQLELLKLPSSQEEREQISQQIIDQTQNLSAVRVGADNVKTLNFDPQLENALASTSQAFRMITQEDEMLANLKNLKKSNENAQKIAEQNLAVQIKEDTDCNHQNFSALRECFNKAEAEGAQRAKFDQIKERLAQYEKNSQINAPLNEAIQCLEERSERRSENSGDQNCLAEIAEKLQLDDPNDIQALRRNIAQIEEQMRSLNELPQIHSLQRAKALALTVYERHGCAQATSIQKSERLRPVCHVKEAELFSQEVLELASNTGQIIEYGSNPFVTKDLKMAQTKFKPLVEDFLAECENSNQVNSYLCDLFKQNEALNGRTSRNIASAMRSSASSRSQAQREFRGSQTIDFSKQEEESPSLWGAAGLGFANVVVGKGVPLFMELDQRNQRHEMQMQYYQNQLERQKKQREYMKNLQLAANLPGQNFYSDYGPYHFRYNDLNTYAGSAQNDLYYSPQNFTQFSFSPQIMSEFGSGQFVPAQGASAAGPSHFEFNFSN